MEGTTYLAKSLIVGIGYEEIKTVPSQDEESSQDGHTRTGIGHERGKIGTFG